MILTVLSQRLHNDFILKFVTEQVCDHIKRLCQMWGNVRVGIIHVRNILVNEMAYGLVQTRGVFEHSNTSFLAKIYRISVCHSRARIGALLARLRHASCPDAAWGAMETAVERLTTAFSLCLPLKRELQTLLQPECSI